MYNDYICVTKLKDMKKEAIIKQPTAKAAQLGYENVMYNINYEYHSIQTLYVKAINKFEGDKRLNSLLVRNVSFRVVESYIKDGVKRSRFVMTEKSMEKFNKAVKRIKA